MSELSRYDADRHALRALPGPADSRKLGAYIAPSEPMFAEVRVAKNSLEIATSVVRARGNKSSAAGKIEIDINGALVRVPAGVDRETLGMVITALRRTQ